MKRHEHALDLGHAQVNDARPTAKRKAPRVLAASVTPEAVKSVYQAHALAVRRKLYRLGIHPAYLDDFSQRVFLVAMYRFDELPLEPPAVRRWLFAIARRLAANWRRRRFHFCEIQDERAIANATSHPDPEGQCSERDLARFTLACLEAEDRELLIRRFLVREPWEETAARLSLSRSGVYNRVDAARRRFVEAAQTIAKFLDEGALLEGEGSKDEVDSMAGQCAPLARRAASCAE
jgi:RNA polymerase sigma factor (sigma-70 family)